MKKTDYEIYLSFSKRPKKYIVAPITCSVVDVKYYCKRFFKCSGLHIDISRGWIYKDKLYFDDPEKFGTRMVYVGYYIR